MLEAQASIARGLSMPVGGKLRALVADDHEQMWSAVERILGDRFDVRYVPDGKALLDALEETMPDVVILDISMPKMSGLEALRALHARGGDLPPTVICSMHREPALLDAALKAGAKGYVYKARAPFDLARAVDAALQDERFVSSEIGSR